MHRLLRKIHPEGIPWPGTVIYNAISATNIFQRHYDLIAQDILSYCSEGALLDIGTGPGRLLKKLYHANPKFRITGLDISPSMVVKARDNMKEAGLSDLIDIREGDARKIPFPDSSFDIVISTGSIHHWKNPINGLKEVYRVLKHGAYALIYDLVSDIPEDVTKSAKKEFGKLKILILWLHAFEEPFYSQKSLYSLTNNTDFNDVQAKFVGVMFCLILKK